MKIDSNNSYTSPSHNAITKPASRTGHGGTTAAREPVGPVKTDSITISGTAILASNSTRANNPGPAFDMYRVAELKNSIHAGSYAINPEQIAEKLHQFTMKLH